ncbi:30S ribosomal protein S6 [Candidatus Peregrinibacteria bacterium]|nr:30S ribosomal protein S6 [Candidatus Peregrinibacteria bacterium]
MARLLSDVQSYELIFIVSPDIGEADSTKKLDEIKHAITSSGGKITAEDNWGMHEMAFRIKKQERGIYFVVNFNFEERSKIAELEKMLFLDNMILRHMLMKTPVSYALKTLKEYEAEAKEIERLEQKAEEEKVAEEEKKAEKRLAKIAPKKVVEKPVKKTGARAEAKKEEVAEHKEAPAEAKAVPVEAEKEAAAPAAEEKAAEAPTKEQKKKQKEDLDELDAKLKQIMDNPDITI